jgi:hypothetical protein
MLASIQSYHSLARHGLMTFHIFSSSFRHVLPQIEGTRSVRLQINGSRQSKGVQKIANILETGRTQENQKIVQKKRNLRSGTGGKSTKDEDEPSLAGLMRQLESESKRQRTGKN